jgi:hypothetical protein
LGTFTKYAYSKKLQLVFELDTDIPQMPSGDAHLQFEKWAREYGPVYSLILGTKALIVLSSDKAVKDLLDKKSNMYSHR